MPVGAQDELEDATTGGSTRTAVEKPGTLRRSFRLLGYDNVDLRLIAASFSREFCLAHRANS